MSTPPDPGSSIVAAAELYLSKGFRVVPLYGIDEDGLCRCDNDACKPRDGGKHEPPATDGKWKDGRTFEAADFNEQMNIALAMGPCLLSLAEGRWLMALDVDGHDDARAFFPDLPPTLTQKTPRGVHCVYTVAHEAPLGNWVDVFAGKSSGQSMTLDIRYARQRIVVAPSRCVASHGDGQGYRWIDWRPPAALPQHVIDTILDIRRQRGLSVDSRWYRKGKQA